MSSLPTSDDSCYTAFEMNMTGRQSERYNGTTFPPPHHSSQTRPLHHSNIIRNRERNAYYNHEHDGRSLIPDAHIYRHARRAVPATSSSLRERRWQSLGYTEPGVFGAAESDQFYYQGQRPRQADDSGSIRMFQQPPHDDYYEYEWGAEEARARYQYLQHKGEREEKDRRKYGHADDEEEYRLYEESKRALWERQRQFKEHQVSSLVEFAAKRDEQLRRRREREDRERRWHHQAEEDEELRLYEEEQRALKERQRSLIDQQERAFQDVTIMQDEERKRRLHKEEEKRAHQSKMAELIRPAGIPKPPPPPPELAYLTSRSQHFCGAADSVNDSSPKPISEHEIVLGPRHQRDHYLEFSSTASWDPPSCASEHVRHKHTVQQSCKAVDKDEKSSHYSSLEKKLSSHSSDYSWKKLQPLAGPIKNDPSYHSVTGSRAGAFAEKPVMVEIEPGFCLPLRGTEVTMQAVNEGRILATCCMACSTALLVKDDCDFVICPGCRVVSPVEEGVGTMGFVGLGIML